MRGVASEEERFMCTRRINKYKSMQLYHENRPSKLRHKCVIDMALFCQLGTLHKCSMVWLHSNRIIKSRT